MLGIHLASGRVAGGDVELNSYNKGNVWLPAWVPGAFFIQGTRFMPALRNADDHMVG